MYVIPFHAVIGEKGGALYGYAYTIYLVFMSLSSAGIPLAMSRIISEYQTLGYHNAKQRAFLLGKRIALLLGFISFLLLSLCAPLIANAILGDLTGGNTIEDVVFVIRIIATAILIVPVLSIYRGYFEGHMVPHEETITIAKSLEVKDNGNVSYRPSVMFLYSPCEYAIKSEAFSGCIALKNITIEVTKENLAALWEEILLYYYRLKEWYKKDELYHKIGYLISSGETTIDILMNETKEQRKSEMENYLDVCIKKSINFKKSYSELSYENNYDEITKVLLLFNVVSMNV